MTPPCFLEAEPSRVNETNPAKKDMGFKLDLISFEVNLNQLKYILFQLQDSQHSLEVETPRPGMTVEASPN